MGGHNITNKGFLTDRIQQSDKKLAVPVALNQCAVYTDAKQTTIHGGITIFLPVLSVKIMLKQHVANTLTN